MVFEVTQPMSAALRRSEEQLKSFVGMVGRQLPADLKGAYALLCVGAGGDPWVPPKGHQRRQQLADQMARKITSGYKALPPIDDDRPAPIRQAELVSPPFAQWVARQAIDMRELLPAGEAVFAVRFDDAREPAFLTAVWLPHRREPEEFQNDYRKLVREANAKVEWLKETGYESFLLLDNRWNRELGSQDPSDLREWHGLPARFPDAPAFDPELEASDFDAIDHILFFSVGSQGLRVETIWRSPDAHVVTPDSWVIKPSGWYDD